MGFIVPNKFLAAEYAIQFRKWLINNSQFVSLTDYSRVKVWDISVYPMIPIFRKANRNLNDIIKVFKANSQSNQDIIELPQKESSALDKIPDNIWSFLTQSGADILIKVLSNSTSLEDVSEVYGSATVAEGSEYPALLTESKVATQDNHSRFVVSGTVFSIYDEVGNSTGKVHAPSVYTTYDCLNFSHACETDSTSPVSETHGM